MKIIIDIPEEVYECCLPFKGSIVISNECNYLPEMTYSIANGTLLPKRHGDLIDRTEVIKSLFDYHNGKKTIGQCIDDVPTIIEADIETK